MQCNININIKLLVKTLDFKVSKQGVTVVTDFVTVVTVGHTPFFDLSYPDPLC